MIGRRSLRDLSAPAAIAYVLLVALSLLARVAALSLGLVAELVERLADAGDVACAAARGPVVMTVRRTSTSAASAV
jgi:hypothetical protein